MHRAIKVVAPLAIAVAVVASASSSARPEVGSANVAAADEYASPPLPSPKLASDIIAGRMVTAKYVTNLARAKADGYRIITRMIPNMGYHFMNPKVTGFNVRKPQILVY